MKPILYLVLLLLTLSCVRKDDDSVVCTEEYRMLNVTVLDADMKPVLLDSTFVTRTSTSEVIRFSQEDPWIDSVLRLQGIYIIFTDGHMHQTSTNGEEFTFHGFLGPDELVSEPYIIAHDLCHVVKVAGRDTIKM